MNYQVAVEHVGTMPERTPAVEYSHNALVAESFAKLGNLFHAIERQLKEVVEGTWEERELCFRRFEPETHELATRAAEAVAAFKRQVFAGSEKYKEKLNASDD